MPDVQVRRYRDAPYDVDNARSKQAKMARPRDLLTWFLTGFRAEMPGDIHAHEVWREYVPDQHISQGGGSLLGSPKWTDPFRRFLEDSPFSTEPSEYEGHKSLTNHYRTPMRAALQRLAGRGSTESGYFQSRMLYVLASTDGDVTRATRHLIAYKREQGVVVVDQAETECFRRTVLEAALRRLYERFHEEPPANYYREDVAVA